MVILPLIRNCLQVSDNVVHTASLLQYFILTRCKGPFHVIVIILECILILCNCIHVFLTILHG